MYESTLMGKFNRLIYVSDKETEDIKQSIIKNKTKWLILLMKVVSNAN